MVEYILGNYLVETGKITREQFHQVLAKQDSVCVKMGLIAVEDGLLTMEQADEVDRMQTETDQSFGDIALLKGYLTEEQIAKLSKQQDNPYLIFMQALMDEELIALEEIDWLMSDFRKAGGYSNSELEDIKSDDVDRILPLMLPDEAKQFQEIIGAAVRTMIQMVDRHSYPGRAAMVDSLPTEPLVNQVLVWEEGIVCCLSERDGGLLKVCSVFGREEFEQLDADSLDAAGEFLNCVSGLYTSNLSRQGIFLELIPPEFTEVREPIKKNTICRIPIFVGEHGLYFTVAEII